MRFLDRLLKWLTGLTAVGAIVAWILALLSGFSSTHVICWGARTSGSCQMSSSPYWTSNTLLWLAPLVLIFVFGIDIAMATLMSKSLPRTATSLLKLVFYLLLAMFVLSQAAGNSL